MEKSQGLLGSSGTFNFCLGGGLLHQQLAGPVSTRTESQWTLILVHDDCGHGWCRLHDLETREKQTWDPIVVTSSNGRMEGMDAICFHYGEFLKRVPRQFCFLLFLLLLLTTSRLSIYLSPPLPFSIIIIAIAASTMKFVSWLVPTFGWLDLEISPSFT